MVDVVIIGAGVIGAMTARELCKNSLSVCVVERANDGAAGASRANSGIVHAGFDAEPGTLKARLNVAGSEKMEHIAEELGVPYKRNGSLVLGYNDEDKATLEKLYRQGQENGVRDLELLNQEQLREAEPGVSRQATWALHAPTGAIICPYELTIAALGNAMDNGAEFLRNFQVTKIQETEEAMVVHAVDGRQVEARYVVNAAGTFADRIAAMLGDDSFSICPRRGEYLLLDRECGGMVHHTLFRTPTKKGKGVLVTPTVDGNLLLGPTAEAQEDPESAETTAAGLAEIISQTGSEAEGIPFRQVITSFAGLRATGSTGDFIIRPWGKRTVHAAGMESPGLSASPAAAEYVVELLRGLGLKTVPREDFQPRRKAAHWFRELSLEEKDAYIREHPVYGKMVCRCETVSEGEILEAIRRAPQALDLDSVKRRTRSGMGRCQGGFCSPRIVELLAEEQGIAFEQVTKSGKGSYLNIGRTKGGEQA